jgi:magnesium-transporting ATPase (P-type)
MQAEGKSWYVIATRGAMKTDGYKRSAIGVLQRLGSDPGQGLSGAEAQKRLPQYGSNELVEKAGRSRAEIIREQLKGEDYENHNVNTLAVLVRLQLCVCRRTLRHN